MTERPFRLEWLKLSQRYGGRWACQSTFVTLESAVEGMNACRRRWRADWRIVDRRTGSVVFPTAIDGTEEADR